MRIAILALLLTLAPPAVADDGRIEINQAAVFAGGITPDDGPGFPVTLGYSSAAPGAAGTRSFVLTGNLDVRVDAAGSAVPDPQHITAIEIVESNVALDLNGFSIFGPGVAGSGHGVTCRSAGITAVTIRDGTIRGMGANGIDCPFPNFDLIIEYVRAIANGSIGIEVGTRSTVRRSIAADNGSRGVDIGSWCTVLQSIVSENGDTGFNTGTNCTIHENLARDSGGHGINSRGRASIRANVASNNGLTGIVASENSAGRSSVRENVAIQNGQRGFDLGTGSTVIGNTAAFNGTLVPEAGFVVGQGSTVIGNSSAWNQGVGMALGSDVGYGRNMVTGNAGGAISGAGVEIGCNAVTP